MLGQSEPMFGKVMFGENAKTTANEIAKEHEKMFLKFEKGSMVKEDFDVTAVMCGMGTGKSTLLQRHLQSMRDNVKHPSLLELLQVASCPLVLNITFNSPMSFLLSEASEDPIACLARRLISSYFRIEWSIASRLPLGVGLDGLRSVLQMIVAHHKQNNSIDASARVAIIINVDELNSILPRRSEDGMNTAATTIRECVRALRCFSMTGVANRCPVFVLYAGTARLEFIEALMGSGVTPSLKTLSVLSPDEVTDLLQYCGVDTRYFSDPDFVRLLEESGGIPRLVRYILESLTVEYDPSRIAIAKMNVETYLLSKKGQLPLPVLLGLLEKSLLGHLLSISCVVVGSSDTTFDELQRKGVMWLKQEKNGEFSVHVPMLLLRMFLHQHLDNATVQQVTTMINFMDDIESSKFELFTAHFRAYKMNTLAQKFGSISLHAFYGGVEMDATVANMQIQLDPCKKYVAPLNHRVGNRFPLAEGVCNKEEGKAVAERAVMDLLEGRVLVNSKGASVDSVSLDPREDGDGYDGYVIQGGCCDKQHTIDSKKLELTEILEDHNKAKNAIEKCEQLKHLTVACITVHISNREVSSKVTAKSIPKSAIVIAKHNMQSYFGSMLARKLLSNSHILRESSPKGRGFCTWRAPSNKKVVAVKSFASREVGHAKFALKYVLTFLR
jgi:hypothetical protein